MDMTRRFFIAGASAFGAFGGCRFFENRSFKAGGQPNLTFGVVSDIHILHLSKPGERKRSYGDTITLQDTFTWFRDQGVDAVVIAGDMADNGMVEQLQAVADVWYRVFPGDRAPDGRHVEKVFVMGNHDYHGYLYNDFAARKYPDKTERARHVLRADFKKHWQEIFHEDYARFYAKDVKGYTFLGAHWDDGRDMSTKYGSSTFGVELKEYLDRHGRTLDPAKPFFYVQHPHPKDTCYGAWAWGHDNGRSTAALSAYANAIAFSGHSHYSLTDERSVWQGAFTSVGTSSLRYTGMPYDERAPLGYENTSAPGKNAWKVNAAKLLPRFSTNDCQQGMLWRVYDDCLVVRRREFQSGLNLGGEWVMPLTVAESRPFAFVEHAKSFDPPQFASGARLKVARTKVKNRGSKPRKGEAGTAIPAVEREGYRVTIPAAIVSDKARAFSFEVVARGRTSGKKIVKYVMAEGFNHASNHAKARAKTFCCFAQDDFPGEEVAFDVTPLNCFGHRGRTLTV